MKYEPYPQAIPPSALESTIRSEMNLQCAAARERPRSMRDFERRAIGLATMDEHMAAGCLSSLPIGRKEGRMRYAPAIGLLMAEVIGASYGNLRVDSLVVEETPRHVRARGFALDLEGNFGASSDVVETAGASDDALWGGAARAEIGRAATAKARREAIFLVAPKSVCHAVEAACLRAAFGNPEAHARSMAAIAAWMNALGIREERVWRALGVAGQRELNVELAATLLGLRNAITDGDTTVGEAFPSDLKPPRFIPPCGGEAPCGSGEPPASAPSMVARLAQLVEACQVKPEAILEYIRAQGQDGTYRTIHATPDAVLHRLVRAWPDVVVELANLARADNPSPQDHLHGSMASELE